jgi:hypothetical protein
MRSAETSREPSHGSTPVAQWPDRSGQLDMTVPLVCWMAVGRQKFFFWGSPSYGLLPTKSIGVDNVTVTRRSDALAGTGLMGMSDARYDL